jgi:hypothetical protein
MQNKMLKEDTKQFYRSLGAKKTEARETPSMTEVEPCWKSVWGEKAEWIRREEESQ